MAEVIIGDEPIGRQMWNLLKRKPGLYDVVFKVGTEEAEVKALKFVLMAASEVFEFFLGKHESGQEIILVDVDPIAFQLFVKLVTLDTWSIEVLKALDLPRNTLLSLLGLCRRFEITKAITNLEAAADSIVRSFDNFKDTSDFLKMSQSDLAAVVSCESLPLEEMTLFECVCRWADFQCTLNKIVPTGENMRNILGPVLFELRFPTMSTTEFSTVCRLQKDLLSDRQRAAVYDFIAMDDEQKEKYDGTQLPFKTHPRKRLRPKYNGSVLSLTNNFKVVDSPPFGCDGADKVNWLQISNGRIALRGMGFCGPIDQDYYLDVAVEIKRYINHSLVYTSGKKEKRIFAPKQQIFHFMFEEPITIEPSADVSTWNGNDKYYVCFSLKGSNTMGVDRYYREVGPVEQAGVRFRFYWWRGRRQVAEYLYEKLEIVG